ncbi:hypothetical protein BGZ63DRAFT_240582 [Mariannaea sp. PMI_226]|nr:hypothetical protein BGZ63DRAFT_240582 [Mariannaea sp. PMI_226]
MGLHHLHRTLHLPPDAMLAIPFGNHQTRSIRDPSFPTARDCVRRCVFGGGPYYNCRYPLHSVTGRKYVAGEDDQIGSGMIHSMKKSREASKWYLGRGIGHEMEILPVPVPFSKSVVSPLSSPYSIFFFCCCPFLSFPLCPLPPPSYISDPCAWYLAFILPCLALVFSPSPCFSLSLSLFLCIHRAPGTWYEASKSSETGSMANSSSQPTEVQACAK